MSCLKPKEAVEAMGEHWASNTYLLSKQQNIHPYVDGAVAALCQKVGLL